MYTYSGRNWRTKKIFLRLLSMQKNVSLRVKSKPVKSSAGFAHAQVLALADKVVEAVKSGAIKKFVVMAGCDGRAKSRDYYTEFC